MARNLVQLMDEEEFEDPLAGSGLEAPPPEPEGLDDSDPALSVDDIQAEPDAPAGWEGLLAKPATPETPEASPAAPMAPTAQKPAAQSRLDSVWDADELKTAQKKDRKSAHLDSASDALYAAFARRPIQKISSTPSREDSLLKQTSLKRQSALDERQLSKDAADEEYRKAALAAKAKPVSISSKRAIARALKMPEDALDDADGPTIRELSGLVKSREGYGAAGERARLGREATSTEKEKDRVAAEKRARIMAASGFGKENRAVERREGEKIEGDVADLGKDLEGTAATKRAIASVEAMVTGSPDAPGVGRWDSIKPDMFDSVKDTAMKQSLKQIVAKVLKKQSGATVSEDEYNRTLSSYGMGRGGTEEAFSSGFAALKADAISAAQESEAKYRPIVTETYRKRGGVASEDFRGPQRQPMPGGELGGGKPAKVIMLDPSGKAFRLDPSEVEEATANGWKRGG